MLDETDVVYEPDVFVEEICERFANGEIDNEAVARMLGDEFRIATKSLVRIVDVLMCCESVPRSPGSIATLVMAANRVLDECYSINESGEFHALFDDGHPEGR